MPDMRDAIAQYLAYNGGQMPQRGFLGGGGVPANLQGYQQLPSGQFMPGQGQPSMPYNPGAADPGTIGPAPMPTGMPDDTIPPGVPQVPPINTPMQAPPIGMPDDTIPPGVPQVGPPPAPYDLYGGRRPRGY